mmetsp:Transcript_7743/g.19130  ORF Transcript_7743/g.19130 Transcript_7743/m.19130 type:complete len:422 (+) Transcript_7743:1675-2940(+)
MVCVVAASRVVECGVNAMLCYAMLQKTSTVTKEWKERLDRSIDGILRFFTAPRPRRRRRRPRSQSAPARRGRVLGRLLRRVPGRLVGRQAGRLTGRFVRGTSGPLDGRLSGGRSSRRLGRTGRRLDGRLRRRGERRGRRRTGRRLEGRGSRGGDGGRDRRSGGHGGRLLGRSAIAAAVATTTAGIHDDHRHVRRFLGVERRDLRYEEVPVRVEVPVDRVGEVRLGAVVPPDVVEGPDLVGQPYVPGVGDDLGLRLRSRRRRTPVVGRHEAPTTRRRLLLLLRDHAAVGELVVRGHVSAVEADVHAGVESLPVPAVEAVVDPTVEGGSLVEVRSELEIASLVVCGCGCGSCGFLSFRYGVGAGDDVAAFSISSEEVARTGKPAFVVFGVVGRNIRPVLFHQELAAHEQRRVAGGGGSSEAQQ